MRCADYSNLLQFILDFWPHGFRYGELNTYLADIDLQAEEMFFQLVKDYDQRQGITERLKAENQMKWVGRINDCKAQAEEVIMAELIMI